MWAGGAWQDASECERRLVEYGVGFLVRMCSRLTFLPPSHRLQLTAAPPARDFGSINLFGLQRQLSGLDQFGAAQPPPPPHYPVQAG